jgi:flagellar hook-length control protein FliK
VTGISLAVLPATAVTEKKISVEKRLPGGSNSSFYQQLKQVNQKQQKRLNKPSTPNDLPPVQGKYEGGLDCGRLNPNKSQEAAHNALDPHTPTGEDTNKAVEQSTTANIIEYPPGLALIVEGIKTESSALDPGNQLFVPDGPQTDISEEAGVQTASSDTPDTTMTIDTSNVETKIAPTVTVVQMEPDLAEQGRNGTGSQVNNASQEQSMPAVVNGEQPNSNTVVLPDHILAQFEDNFGLTDLGINPRVRSTEGDMQSATSEPLADDVLMPVKGANEEAGTAHMASADNKTVVTEAAKAMPAKGTKEEAGSAQIASVDSKTVAKEAPEAITWARKLMLTETRGKPPASSDSGAEEKQNQNKNAVSTADSKTSSGADVKKLIDFESHRLNASRLSSEPQTTIDGKAQITSDDGKTIISSLIKNDTEVFKASAGWENSKNLPTAKEIMAQVVQKAELLFNHKLSELKIDLKPEFLGRLTIKVMVEEGVVTARFIAENQQVRHLLETNLHTLRNNLESQGLRVDRAEVNVGLNNGGLFDGSEGDRHYLWQEGQSSGRQQSGMYTGDDSLEAVYLENGKSGVVPEDESDFNENGQLSFLI